MMNKQLKYDQIFPYNFSRKQLEKIYQVFLPQNFIPGLRNMLKHVLGLNLN